ncbi:cell filamentation protein Fic [Acetobacter malorum]|uniref:Cell filamentation protein Fic n=1 Tax=Acetobacter malorum TaxID=178901 RepID=A0A149UZG0_9PROT|nr:cell filamentation protein Fic [Acetobacter malorum]KXV73298.1 cell filamentation protein Fic [Acetobacter malorum]
MADTERSTLLGGRWLGDNFGVDPCCGFPVTSTTGSRRESRHHGFESHEIYPESMRPVESPAGHLQFHLRYEPTNLELLARVFEVSGPDFVRDWIEREPTGQYARRAAFLYEFLTGHELETEAAVGGNYVSALNDELVVTASQDHAINIKKWRVRDNMPGTRHFCPSIWKSRQLEGAAGFNIAARYTRLQEDFGDDMLARAAVWLTNRESRASFAIEGEADQTDKIALFSHVLATRTGKGAVPLLGSALVELQKDIIGSKTFISSFGPRKSPVFVGENTIRGEVVHYVAPPPEDLKDMLDGLAAFLKKTRGQSPILRAAVVSFGFVYIHPLADGNGRTHRYLINDILCRDNAIPDGVIIPVSVAIMADKTSRRHYDAILERVSNPLMRVARPHVSFASKNKTYPDAIQSNLVFTGDGTARPAWRYPDLARHVDYLGHVIRLTMDEHMQEEADYLRRHYTARELIKAVLDMPDKDADRIIRSLHSNNFIVSNGLWKEFSGPEVARQVTDDEWKGFAESVRLAFQND